jgi:hypothetical protein
MKAVATALVLIVGAAVVLWYGNTLNSWVVGGLVGGLAALLVSIPLSLVLFSYFARHREESEKHRDDAFNQESFAEEVYHHISARQGRNAYETRGAYQVVEESVPQHIATWGMDEEYRTPSARQLPPPSSNRPTATRGNASQRLPMASRNAAQERGVTTHHPTRQLPEYQTLKNSQKYGSADRSQLQAQALRAARMEASKQYRDQGAETYGYREEQYYSNSDYATYGSERGSEIYRQRRLLEEDRLLTNEQETFSQRRRGGTQRRTRRIVDSTLRSEDGYEEYTSDNSASSTYEGDEGMFDEQNSAARERYTDRIVTPPANEKVGRSLVRRAPYLYDDDPMREEFAPYVQEPITRRSSRYLTPLPDEEEQE